MNFLKNLLLFVAMFAAGIVVLDVAGLVDVKIPGFLGGENKEAQVESSTGVSADSFVGTATVANLQQIPEPTCKENEISTIEEGKVVCKIPQPARDLDCIDPSGLTVKEGDSIKLAKPELKKCLEAEFVCRDGKLTYNGTETTGSPSIVEYKYDVKECRPLIVGGIPCNAPWGNEKFDDGQLFIAYEKEIVAKDQDCRFEKLACLGGQLKQKFGYKYKTCAHAEDFSLEYIKEHSETLVETNSDGSISVAQSMTEDTTNTSKKSCSRFSRTVQDGENIYAFKDQTVPFENDCEFEIKVCRDGSFATPNKGYEFKECFIGKGADCSIGTTTLEHSKINTYYAKYDTTLKDCPSQVRRCWNGTPDGDEQYIYATCGKPAAPKVTTTTSSPNRCPNPYVGESAVVEHGRQGVGYYDNSVGRLESCEGENKVSVSCQYGTLQPIGNTKKIWRSCTKGTPKDCRSPWGSNVPHGQSVVAFERSSITYGGVCQSEVRICNDGNLAGTFTNQSCSVAQPASCVAPWGDSVLHNGSVVAYQTDSVAYGSTCGSQSRVCNNGVLAGAYVYRSCTVNPPVDCTYNGSTIKHGQIIARYKEPQVMGAVADGTDQCVRYTATCTNGSLQGTLISHPEAVYLQCTTIIPNNGSNQ